MNGSAPPAPSNNSACSSGSAAAEDVGFTKNHSSFVVLTRLQAAENDPTATPKLNQPNVYVIRFVHGTDLTPAAKDTKVTVNWDHVKTTTATTQYHADSLVQQADGSYLATITFKGKNPGGTYEIHVDLIEGTTEDEHVYTITI
jgi:hypothetical protein